MLYILQAKDMVRSSRMYLIACHWSLRCIIRLKSWWLILNSAASVDIPSLVIIWKFKLSLWHNIIAINTINIIVLQFYCSKLYLFIIYCFTITVNNNIAINCFQALPVVDAFSSSASLQLPASALHSSVHLLPSPPFPSWYCSTNYRDSLMILCLTIL